MSYGRVCDRLFLVIITGGVVAFLLWFVYRIDEELQYYPLKRWMLVGEIMAGSCSLFLYPVVERGVFAWCAAGLMSIYLAVSTTMDVLLKRVSDFVHWFGLMGALLRIGIAHPDSKILWELIIYVCIQYQVFSRLYGGADVIVFVVCALFLAAMDRGIEAYTGHMLGTFAELAVVQSVRGNIAPDGNLKQPVALYPYIISVFLLTI